MSSLGRLGLLIHSTAGYVDPGWKGNLTLELSNVANLPIALYYGMRIGQISFFKMSSPVDRPYGSPELRSNYQGQTEPTASAFHRDFDGDRTRPSVAINDAVDWRHRPRRRHARRAGPGGHLPLRRRERCSGRCRGSCGTASSRDEIDARAPPAPGAQLPADRDAGGARPGRDRHRRAGRRQDPGDARLRGPVRSCRRWRPPGSCPRPSTSWR